ncbi:MAG: fibrobacter succinogenes major paralogous domain-containing protein [Ferruginibacter sp.]
MKKNGLLVSLAILISLSVVAQSEVKIGKQIWMLQNLQVDTFRNGDIIPWAQSNEEWIKAGKNKQPAWCYYASRRYLGDSSTLADNGLRFGKLYNWYAVNDPRGLAPLGWHVPTKAEWSILVSHLGGTRKAAIRMRHKNDWREDDKGTNRSGFTALPGGFRTDSSFYAKGNSGYWWTTTEEPETGTNTRPANVIIDFYRLTEQYYVDFGTGGRNTHLRYEDGLSVRCLKD